MNSTSPKRRLDKVPLLVPPAPGDSLPVVAPSSSPQKNSMATSSQREPTLRELVKLADEIPYRSLLALDAYVADTVAQLERDNLPLDWSGVAQIVRNKFTRFKRGGCFDSLLSPEKLRKLHEFLLQNHAQDVQALTQHRDYGHTSEKRRLSLIMTSRQQQWNSYENTEGCRGEFRKAMSVFDDALKNQVGQRKLEETVKSLDKVLVRFFETIKTSNFRDVHLEYIPSFQRLYKRFAFKFPIEEPELGLSHIIPRFVPDGTSDVNQQSTVCSTVSEHGRALMPAEAPTNKQLPKTQIPPSNKNVSQEGEDVVVSPRSPVVRVNTLPAKTTSENVGLHTIARPGVIPAFQTSISPHIPLQPAEFLATKAKVVPPEPVTKLVTAMPMIHLTTVQSGSPKRSAPEELPTTPIKKPNKSVAIEKTLKAPEPIQSIPEASSSRVPSSQIQERPVLCESKLHAVVTRLQHELASKKSIPAVFARSVTAFLLSAAPSSFLDCTPFKLDVLEQLTDSKGKAEYRHQIYRSCDLYKVAVQLKSELGNNVPEPALAENGWDLLSLFPINAFAFNKLGDDICEEGEALVAFTQTVKSTLLEAKRQLDTGIREKSISDRLKQLSQDQRPPIPPDVEADVEPLFLTPRMVPSRIIRRPIKTPVADGKKAFAKPLAAKSHKGNKRTTRK